MNPKIIKLLGWIVMAPIGRISPKMNLMIPSQNFRRMDQKFASLPGGGKPLPLVWWISMAPPSSYWLMMREMIRIHLSRSPDGSNITFCSDRRGTSDIYYLKIASKKISELIVNKSHDVEPRFSPDGKNILFISNARGMKFRDLMLVNLKSKKVINLTQNLNRFNQNPVFLPDGRSILFESICYEDSEIYEIGIDGQNLKNLTNHPRWDLAPAW